jgi:hypothetical protein
MRQNRHCRLFNYHQLRHETEGEGKAGGMEEIREIRE